MRLGSKEDMKEVLDHPWFKDIDYKALHGMAYDAPYIPKLSDDPKDTSQFDSQFTEEDPINSVLPDSAISKIKKHADEFKEF